MVEVTQEDRLAAMQIYQRFRDHDYAKWIGDGTNAGGDGDTVIQAFARHRIAAENAVLERAAKVAEKWIEPVMATPHENATYRSIATAIRALEGPTDDPA